MSENQNNQQGSEQGNLPKTQEQKTQNVQSDKDKNFEALRKSNEQMAKKLAQFEKEKEEQEKKKLEEEGNYKELIAKERKGREEIEAKYKAEKQQIILEKELSKSGINPELVDLAISAIQSQVKFNDDNQPDNLTEILENLKTTKPSLFDESAGVKPAGKVGAGVSSNPNNSNSLSADKAKAILESGDYSMYTQHRDQILKLRQKGEL